MRTKLAIIGAGPAGMAAAEAAADIMAPEDITVLDRNDQPGRKLLLTGNGRCNITNTETIDDFIARVPDGKFLYSAFHRFYTGDTIALLDRIGIGIKLEGERYYPASESAKQVRDRWASHLRSRGIHFRQNFRVTEIRGDGDYWIINDSLTCDRLILAGGGASVPRTGSDGSLLKLAEGIGIPCVPFRPALCGIKLKGKRLGELQGIRLSGVRAALTVNGTTLGSEYGDVLFTHFGVSGPAILDVSRFTPVKPRDVRLQLDLTAAWEAPPLEQIRSAISASPKRGFVNALKPLLPIAVGEWLARLAGIDKNAEAGKVGDDKLLRFVDIVTGLSLDVLGNVGFEQAILSCGGIRLTAVNPRTMALKAFEGLYAAGEILDLAGPSGGYNLQIAIATGHVAGRAAAESLA